MVHGRQVLQALQDNDLLIHAEKCVWGVQELEYLGHKISAAGVLLLPSHMAAIQDFPPPNNHPGAAGFLGHGELLQAISAQNRPHAAAAH